MTADALTNALAGLTVAKTRIDTISRNVSNASTEGYSRKVQGQSVTSQGIVQPGIVRRAVDDALTRSVRQSLGDTNRLDVTVDMLSQIEAQFGLPDENDALSAALTKLQTAFHDLSVSPQKDAAYGSAVTAADTVARTFRNLYQAAEAVRQNATDQIAAGVATVNDTLQQIARINTAIVAGHGTDVSDLEDERDRLLGTLSGLMDVTTFKKSNGAVAVYTTNGLPLVDATAQTIDPTAIAAQPSQPPAPPVTVIKNGTLGGLLTMRDTTMPKFEAQLDDMARALTVEFKGVGVELFNDGGSTTFAVPVDPVQLAGYAARIDVNDTIRATPSKIRDGNSATPLDPGDTTFIDGVVNLFNRTDVAFTASTGLPPTGGLVQAATDFVAAHSNDRATADSQLQHETTLQQIFKDKLSKVSGVSTDDEMAQLIQFQQAYAANAKVVATVGQLLQSLFQAVS